MLLPGAAATQARRQAASLLCRWLGGDLSLIDEVCRARGFQEQLAVRAPEHPARVFGEAVEAGGVTDAAGACEQIVGRMLPPLLNKLAEKLTETLDERFAAFEKQHRARGGPYALPNADPRPLTLAQFLKERSDPVPKNFAPAFGTLVAVPVTQSPPTLFSAKGGRRAVSCPPPGVQAAGGQGAGYRSRDARPLHGAGPAHHGALLESCASISTRPRRPRQHF